jgi:SPP1 family predicted phage head-tail adaptor
MPRGPKTEAILERVTEVSDGMGSSTSLWTGRRYISGVFSQLSSNEVIRWSKIVEQLTHKFVFDHPQGITVTTADRFRINQKIFDIVGLEPQTQRAHQITVILNERTT